MAKVDHLGSLFVAYLQEFIRLLFLISGYIRHSTRDKLLIQFGFATFDYTLHIFTTLDFFFSRLQPILNYRHVSRSGSA